MVDDESVAVQGHAHVYCYGLRGVHGLGVYVADTKGYEGLTARPRGDEVVVPQGEEAREGGGIHKSTHAPQYIALQNLM